MSDVRRLADAPAGLAAALSRIGVRVTGPARVGTSCTRLYRARSEERAPLMVKVLQAGAGRVDGHDLTTFYAKRRQVSHLRALDESLAGWHVPILVELRGAGWAAHVMPFVAGRDLLAGARRPGGDRRALADIGTVLAALAGSGYVPYARPRRGDYLASAHLDRIRRRLDFLAPPVIPRAALRGPGCEVNGVPCEALLPVLDRLAGDGRLRRLLQPRLLSPPVHGDLNTRNVLVRPPGDGPPFVLVDPRGTVRPVDVGYDLAKLALSVALWDPVLRHDPRVDLGGTGGRIEVVVPSAYPQVLRGLPATFATAGALRGLLSRSGPWQARTAFSHATHAIAEAACRVSDARANAAFAPARAANTARAFFYVGLLLLNDVVARLARADELDLAEHWRLLDRVHRPSHVNRAETEPAPPRPP